MTNPPTVVMVLYEINMLLVCFIRFCPTDEQTSVLAYDKGKPELLLRIIFLCVPLVVCLSEIIVSESSSNLIQHACIMLSYLYMILILVTNLLLKFLLTCSTIQHSVWHLWLLQSPRCQRRPILQYTLACT